MISYSEARSLAQQFADAATGNDPAAWSAGSQALGRMDGRSWLLIDQTARSFSYVGGAPVSGVRGWLGPSLSEPSGFVAAVTSTHIDGRYREWAVQVLGTVPAAIAAPALAVRLLDHVPQIRARAWEALRPLVGVETAEALLDVLLAGTNRRHANDALNAVKAALFDAAPTNVLMEQLMSSDRRRVRRWAFRFGHHRSLLAPEQLVVAAQGDPDQWIRAVCAEWLMQAPDPRVLVSLLEARSVEARLVAVRRVPESDLNNDTLAALLVDRTPRVREEARKRARLRDLDLVKFYRRRLTEESPSPHLVVACLDGLALTGSEADLDAAVTRLQHPSPRVRAAAVAAVEALTTRSQAIELLTPMLLDPSPRVCAATARGLARLGPPLSVAEQAWASDQPWSRRAAWRLTRAASGWHRVEADLRASADTDPQLALLGHDGIRNWFEVSAATTWQPLPAAQRERLAALLARSDFDRVTQRRMAFHAGIEPPLEERTARSVEDPPESPIVPERRSFRLFRQR